MTPREEEVEQFDLPSGGMDVEDDPPDHISHVAWDEVVDARDILPPIESRNRSPVQPPEEEVGLWFAVCKLVVTLFYRGLED